jgi:hypothetical protein
MYKSGTNIGPGDFTVTNDHSDANFSAISLFNRSQTPAANSTHLKKQVQAGLSPTNLNSPSSPNIG